MKVIVLASGGLDSICLLYKAVKDYGSANTIALSLYYGQKHDKELECLNWQANHLGIEYYIRDLSAVFDFNKDCSALLKGSSREIEHKSYAEQLAAHHEVSAYVPYRNGLFLSYAAAVALQLGAEKIFYGAHADDAAGHAYPDCTEEFIAAQKCAIEEGTGNKVTLEAPWSEFTKAQVVHAGLTYGMTQEEFDHTWSCYEGGNEPCGVCGTCRDRIKALRLNGLEVN